MAEIAAYAPSETEENGRLPLLTQSGHCSAAWGSHGIVISSPFATIGLLS